MQKIFKIFFKKVLTGIYKYGIIITETRNKTHKGERKMKLKNFDELLEQLTEMLIEFDCQLNQYNTDVYMYYDADTHTATLDTFVNVGGSSWIDDNHITIYTDKQHTVEEIWDSMGGLSEDEICEEFGMTAEELEKEIRKVQDLDDDDEVSRHDMKDYIESKDEYMDKIVESYEARLREFYSDYESTAYNALKEAEKEINCEED